MTRFFSTFARGAPGTGLLLLRLAGGATAITGAILTLDGRLTVISAVPPVLSLVAGALLVPGIWTPVSGALLAILQVWEFFSARPAHLSDILAGRDLLLGTVGAALALLGPGGWSVDAWLFGWRRIDVRDRTN